MAQSAADAEADRLEKLLDEALFALQRDDFDGADMLLAESVKTAQRMAKAPPIICLPDLSKGASHV